MSDSVSYRVPGIQCDRCTAAIEYEVGAVHGVDSVEVDLDAKLVTVVGLALDDAVLRAAIDEAGYEVEG